MTNCECVNCGWTGNESELIEVDNGNYEEYFGARVWRQFIEVECPNCGSPDDLKIEGEY
jgi:hypothetical protein